MKSCGDGITLFQNIIITQAFTAALLFNTQSQGVQKRVVVLVCVADMMVLSQVTATFKRLLPTLSSAC
jgi:hypothetical protein